ncbi:chemotaxis protein CheW [Nibricoccus sp. IMCC34717]|uniref:chemotaxis protein CheW n=1 Tax=Nibricoccus sp. IMCC34717 TaxID=3034021 RepID=UPI0038505E25
MSSSTSTRSLCTFSVGGLFFGVDVLSVQEVLRPRPLAPVPLASPEIEGLVNLRGQVVTTLDLRRRLGFTPRKPSEDCMLMIARTADGCVGMLVDTVGDVIDVQESDFELPPENIPAQARDLVPGVYKLPKRLLHVLDLERASTLS